MKAEEGSKDINLSINKRQLKILWTPTVSVVPYRLWNVCFHCPNATCSQNSLTSVGGYPYVRGVLDVSEFYYLATEYLRCGRCLKKLIGWSRILLDQLEICL